MKDGFYWGTLNIDIHGERSGVVFVKNGTGFLHGFALKIFAYDFGPNPTAITPPEWMIKDKLKQKELEE